MSNPMEDPDRVDPTKQSGRPFQVMGFFGILVAVLVVMLVVGIVVL
ncbi:hypothetical protein [Nocardioides solisilvae]|nr:hypothetical protein [Nocardioides solisilvae]